jgi:type II secretory pathway component PulJ
MKTRFRQSNFIAFTLLEVMIAVAIFFMATFSILALMSRCLSQARSLQPMQVDANMVVAELSLTNKLEEGPIPPEIIRHRYAPASVVSGDGDGE